MRVSQMAAQRPTDKRPTAAWSSNAALLPPPDPDPLVALCQGPGQEVICCEAGGEVPNFLGLLKKLPAAPAAGPANAAMAIKFL
jgi:hypothetical protein